jgi:hypothetical protein
MPAFGLTFGIYGPGAVMGRLLHTGKVMRRVYERHVGEGLGEISEEPSGIGFAGGKNPRAKKKRARIEFLRAVTLHTHKVLTRKLPE